MLRTGSYRWCGFITHIDCRQPKCVVPLTHLVGHVCDWVPTGDGSAICFQWTGHAVQELEEEIKRFNKFSRVVKRSMAEELSEQVEVNAKNTPSTF